MKKAILIILSIILIIATLFTVIILNLPKTELSFDQPTQELKNKIETAVADNGLDVHYKLYKDYIDSNSIDKPEKIGEPNVKMYSFTKLNGNYLFSYRCYNTGTYFSTLDVNLGKYTLRFSIGSGQAFYVSSENKLITYKEAYDKGLLTNADLKAMFSYQEECEENNKDSELPFRIIKD